MIESIVPPNIRTLVPYPPGKPLSELERELGIEGAIKLASNENALGPSPRAVEAIRAALPELHRYPDAGGFYLRRRLAEGLEIPADRIILGNGSNEIIELLIRTVCDAGHGVLTSDCTFVVYRLVAQAAGVPFQSAPMRDHTFDLDAIAERVGPSTRLIFLCNPNNPTGTRFDRPTLDRFLARVGDEPVVVLDEAYVEFVPEREGIDALDIVRTRERTMVLRTFSKAYGLAGARVGYGIGAAELVDYLNRVRQPFNVNALAQIGALAALDDTDHLARVLAATAAGKAAITEALEALGLTVTPSATNFLLFDAGRPAGPVYDALLRRGVIVRPMAAYGLPNHLRVNVGLESENARFLDALRQVLG